MSDSYFLQQNATTNGAGTAALTGSSEAVLLVEIIESAGGTATVTLTGSFDGTLVSGAFPYVAAYQRVDNQATLTRAVTGISVGANSRQVVRVLEPYPQLMATISSVAGGANVTVRLFSLV